MAVRIVKDLLNPTKEEIEKLVEGLEKYRTGGGYIPTLTQFSLKVGIPVDILKDYIQRFENLKYEYDMLMTRYQDEMLKGAFGQGGINPYGAQFILERQFGYTKKEKVEVSSVYENMSDEELAEQLQKAKDDLSEQI